MIRDTRLVLGFGIAMILVLGSASSAHAQYQAPPPGYGYPPPPPPRRMGMYRDGLVIGFAVGGGDISASNCPACGGGFAGEFHIGGMLNPRLALMADFWGIAHSYDDGAGGATLTNSMVTAAIQYWVADQVWLKGGIGGARITLSDANGNAYGSSEGALALLGAAGVEVLQVGNFALDLQFRLGYGAYSGGGATNVAFLVGFNWY
jgi:hypothetical protein